MAAPEGERENWDVLGEYTNKTLRLKADRWTKAMHNEDTRSTILDFLDGNAEQVNQLTLFCLFVSSELKGKRAVIK